MQLGGHCDGDSDVRRVSKKEAIEESGIRELQAKSNDIFDIDIHLIPESKTEKSHFHYDMRFHFATKVIDVTISTESNDLRWFKKEELPSSSTYITNL